jgi:hypothetical protein
MLILRNLGLGSKLIDLIIAAFQDVLDLIILDIAACFPPEL